ncbi:tRNA(Met) cytidine acetyltransferase [Halogranum amylolyticum]|uniref:tRNA(Met) cytidine acetyltransferase TmcA n=1 Tax=Halogranum amylolyticum TaxID=660520 RepID=A0A1H8RXA3_9EURY|nr:tRNA(Met) cytidine acetyltransferase TmcA [Halogranum amylolyticum]SEO70995.1 tRNA(Met) cytidine acetyltransferase [Halogranum amylolyticum]
MTVSALAGRLRAEAERANERRLLVLAGDRDAGIDAAYDAVEGAGYPDEGVTVVTATEGFRFERLHPKHADRLLGTTRDCVVLDAHGEFSPNAIGRTVGAVDGGGLLVLLTPPLDEWPTRRGGFDEYLAVPPFTVDDVTGRFRKRLVDTLREHPGVAVVDLVSGAVERDGLTDAPPAGPRRDPPVPADAQFPRRAYESCLTADQARAVRSLELLRESGHAVVVEADRGRGKSSAAGLAAGSLAAEGRDVLVTAPKGRNAAEVFVRARTLLAELGALAGETGDDEGRERHLRTIEGGHVRFADPPTAATLPGDPDVVVVDEAAALPVRLLSQFVAAPSVGFFTTIHGYEGAGRGFSVRFQDRLAESDMVVRDVHLDDPIRYARNDPVETWAFRALLLDARPAVDPLVEAATVDDAEYRVVSADELVADEHLLNEAFGLLVLAHYRTEPTDLARLLDAPNLSLRALLHDGHVVSVALLAREGGLDAETRREMYDGGRVRGNMLPDVLTSQLRDEDAAVPVGYRVMRIATHHAVRSQGLGSRLLTEIREEFGDDVDWLGVGYGATPELLDFWDRNGYRTVHLSTTRNATSGEYSAIMLDPTSDAGREVQRRHTDWFLRRVEGVLADSLDDIEPDVARAAVRAAHGTPPLDLSERDWRVVAGASYGPGLYGTAPRAFRDLAVRHLADPERAELTAREERLLVRKVLQCRPWDAVADELGYHSTGQCMRSLGDAYKPLVDAYGSDVAHAERERYTE